jgi:hypothetical protein
MEYACVSDAPRDRINGHGSFELEDVLAKDPQNYDIPNETAFLKVRLPVIKFKPMLTQLSKAAVEAVANSSGAISDPQVFDVFRSVLKYSTSVPQTVIKKVLDSLWPSKWTAQCAIFEPGDQTNRETKKRATWYENLFQRPLSP